MWASRHSSRTFAHGKPPGMCLLPSHPSWRGACRRRHKSRRMLPLPIPSAAESGQEMRQPRTGHSSPLPPAALWLTGALVFALSAALLWIVCDEWFARRRGARRERECLRRSRFRVPSGAFGAMLAQGKGTCLRRNTSASPRLRAKPDSHALPSFAPRHSLCVMPSVG